MPDIPRPSLILPEVPAPSAPGANQIVVYAFDNGVGAQIRSKDEYGLIDVLSNRDRMRARKRFSIGLGSDTGAAADLLNQGVNMVGAVGTLTNVAGDADGERKNIATSATTDADTGFLGGFTMGRRAFNVDVTIKFKVVSTAVRRVWIGWFESAHQSTDTNAAQHKFALRLSTSAANVNFCIVHSDGTTETITQIATADAAIHTIRLLADDANSRWGYSWDGGAITWVTTNIPASTDNVGLSVVLRTLEAVAKNMDLWFVEGSMEK